VPRRVRVPAPDELFRPTVVPAPDTAADDETEPAAAVVVAELAVPESVVPDLAVVEPPAPATRAASGRVKHEEKMTVYVTSEELLDLEDARLALRRTHRIAVDRGRLVRAAVALALADLDAHGADSALVRRLHER
jgi:hypothetical protein